jgi:2-polyprenyl-3-methyl-5-hydroxy-6-metoxy-1,4-benzoquinol methylase
VVEKVGHEDEVVAAPGARARSHRHAEAGAAGRAAVDGDEERALAAAGVVALDVGAADGLLSRQLTERGWRVTAIEGDPALAQAGARHCERMITMNLDREIPGGEGPFDVIVYGDVLEHLVDPLRVLVELDRSLGPGGFVILSVPNIAHLWIRLLLLVGRFDYLDRGILDQSHLRFFTERSLRAMLADAGLSIERFTATPAPLYQILPVSWHRRWVAATHAINAVIARKVRRLLGYQFIVLAYPKGAAERPGAP